MSKYASVLFGVRVAFVDRDGTPYPVIIVPEGVTSPVAAKADLFERPGGARLIAHGDVYFRSLNANGIASTTRARPEDWPDIIDICVGNREGDIATFLRRYFPGPATTEILAAMGDAAMSPPSPDLRERAKGLLDEGLRRFLAALDDK
jgi:hypothetical protein